MHPFLTPILYFTSLTFCFNENESVISVSYFIHLTFPSACHMLPQKILKWEIHYLFSSVKCKNLYTEILLFRMWNQKILLSS
jgi:hypothetical protein